ncbi:MAG: nucleotidyltransferase family protein [Chloroflexi bacterium]|nr:nucleotidyltransferase family protein [Chloroflexota bacterium]
MDQSVVSILLTCLGYASEAAKAERLACVSAEEWRMVAELAQQHGVKPLLYHHLKRLGIALHGELAEELKQAYLKNAARNMRLYQELGKLLRRLREQDIAVIALKGAHLAEAVYDNIGLRTMGDVDLLVKKEDLLCVEQELLALGYKPDDCNRVIAQDNHHFHYTLPKNGLPVEIHWVLVASKFPLQVGIQGLWSRAQPVTLAQVPVLALSPADLLLHLCLHTAVHTYDMRIRMLCDIGEVVRRYGTELDWQGIGARARQWGIAHAVYVILRLAQELLEVAVPADWLALLEPAGFDERYLVLARQQILAADADGGMAQKAQAARLWGPKGLGNKIAIIRDSLLPSRASMAIMYPAPVNSWRIYLYYPVRLKDVLARHGTTLWRLVRRDPKTRDATERSNQVTALRDWLLSK